MATATADPNQRRLMLLLPLVFVVFLFRYPAGLLVYWITTNLWTIGQQYFIKQRMAAAGQARGQRDGSGRPSLAQRQGRSLPPQGGPGRRGRGRRE